LKKNSINVKGRPSSEKSLQPQKASNDFGRFGRFWPILAVFGSFWPFLPILAGDLDRFWPILADIGRLGRFWPTRSRIDRKII
jgi:hypothetical protein